MGQILCCRNKHKESGTPERGCISRALGCCGEKTLLTRITGRGSEIPDYGETRFKSLSFYDFDDEDKSNLLREENKHTDLGFDDSEYDMLSDC